MRLLYSILGTALLGTAMIAGGNTVVSAKGIDSDYSMINNVSYVEEDYDYDDNYYCYNGHRNCGEYGKSCYRENGRSNNGRRYGSCCGRY